MQFPVYIFLPIAVPRFNQRKFGFRATDRLLSLFRQLVRLYDNQSLNFGTELTRLVWTRPDDEIIELDENCETFMRTAEFNLQIWRLNSFNFVFSSEVQLEIIFIPKNYRPNQPSIDSSAKSAIFYLNLHLVCFHHLLKYCNFCCWLTRNK